MRIRPLRRVSDQTRRRARELRRAATGPERRLWSALERRRLAGLKFRRQHPIEPYIADFYCPQAGLVVELDGMSHDDRADQDAQRTVFLEKLGLRVLRVTNDDVMHDLDAVAETILREAERRLPKGYFEGHRTGSSGSPP